MGAFVTHLVDAIRINKKRAPEYARLTAGRSRKLSRLLIWAERSSLPLAFCLDGWARRFQRAGIPIVTHDFVSMDAISPVDTPPRFQGRMAPGELERLARRLRAYRTHILAANRQSHFRGIADLSAELLAELTETERSSSSSLCMSRHIVESLGLAALNAIAYAAQSGGATTRLSRALVRVQSLALPLAPMVDRLAQECHALGAGIVQNDVPPIPFLAAWEAGRTAASHTE